MADEASARQAMMRSDNPLLLMRTSRGDIYLELLPASAPRNVANFIALAEGTAELAHPLTGERVRMPYYDNLSFHRVLPGYLVQAGRSVDPERPRPDSLLPDEINANQLGLHRINVLGPGNRPHAWLNIQNREDFERLLLAPLYRRLGIESEYDLAPRQFEVLRLLQEMTLQQAYENYGYRFSNTLAPHRPSRGSLVLANTGPDTNAAEFFIPVQDAPWLTGTHTVIGQVVHGLDVVDRIHQQSAGRLSSPSATAIIYDIRQLPATGSSVAADRVIGNQQTTRGTP
jgi:cyclophilin family peptidyl-prolyl cis-trans isomerase